jgi:hypothetical protein
MECWIQGERFGIQGERLRIQGESGKGMQI